MDPKAKGVDTRYWIEKSIEAKLTKAELLMVSWNRI